MWSVLLVLSYPAILAAKKLTYHADFERPNITYFNPDYFEYFEVKAQRYNRHDPVHYVNIRMKTLIVLGNNIMVTINVHEFLSNEYRPSMIVMRFRLCDITTDHKFVIFKPIYKKIFDISSCPCLKGEYTFMNISLLNEPVLGTFPLRKGRIFVSLVHKGKERALEGYVDLIIKEKYQ